jgi:predicted nucleotidyltransferase component of viral defense system
MKRSSPKDIGVSVRDRLLRLARQRGEGFQLLLTRYANERLLFRLASSKHGPRFVLKGATLFTLWTGKPHRATRDVDLLGLGVLGEEHVREILIEVLTLDVADDGVKFDMSSLDVGPIRKDQEHGGVRATVVARVTSAQVRLQVDVGFGDAITPEAAVIELPPLLDFPGPRVSAYPRETVVAEKLEAMVQLGMANSRMKDFYDLLVLSMMFDFDGEVLVSAIRATFQRRKTPWPMGTPVALTPTFADDPAKKLQWAGFVRKSGAGDAGSLHEAIVGITVFVEKPLIAASSGTSFASLWRPGGSWMDREVAG